MTRCGLVRGWLTGPVTYQRNFLAVIGTVGVATALRWLCGPAADAVPFVTYFPAIIVCTLIGGWRAGLACLIVSVIVVDAIFVQERFWLAHGYGGRWTLFIFLASCSLLIAIAQTLRSNMVELQLATAQAEYLNAELVHRVRNTLAIVNSIAAQTFKSEPTAFPKIFSQRIAALSSGLDVLIVGRQAGCDMRAVVEASCRPFQHEDCIIIHGPSHTLPSRVCVPLTLAIHELCTNSVKYGALSADDGKVRIELATGEAGNDAVLTWVETGGPEVRPPVRTGLGSVLMRHPLLGPAEMTFDPKGLKCLMRLQAGLGRELAE